MFFETKNVKCTRLACFTGKQTTFQWVNYNHQVLQESYYDRYLWLCSHGLESRSERRFRMRFGPFLIWKPDFSPCERKAVSNQASETHFKMRKKGVLDHDPPDSRTCERKALSECDSCLCIIKMRTEAMHKCMGQSARADCAVWAKYYLAVRRSWSSLGRHLQCMWTHVHVVQITIPITFWIAIRNVFRNVILVHVNTAYHGRCFNLSIMDEFIMNQEKHAHI